MSKTVVAIVGRPNVGKSTLFNKLAGKRISIVEDTPGVTRDRVFADCEWCGRSFMLVDTGGIEPRADDTLLSKMKDQAELAIEASHVIIFMTDLKSGVTASDYEIATMLRKSGKPVLLCVNKVDSLGKMPSELYEFYNLGIGEPFPVSSVHGHGTGDLLDEAIKYFINEDVVDEPERIKVAVIGKPNVGKSSLVNRIMGEERMIVSDIAGTTRDAIDMNINNSFGKYTFIDTAGIRRRSKVDESIERYSVLRSEMAIERCDVCVIMIDATEGFSEQDSKIAGEAVNSGKGCIVAVNKWDSIDKETGTMERFRKKLENDLSFISYAPIVFISAKTGQRIDRLFELINYVREQNAMRISTGKLNDILAEAVAHVQPPTDKGRRLKILYITQASTCPPTFVLFCNRLDLFHYSYQRYIENRIRGVFGMEGTPIRFILRERNREGTR